MANHYTKRQLSVLVEQACNHHGSLAALGRHLGLQSTTSLWRAIKCRSTDAAFPPGVGLVLGLRELPNSYSVYETAVDARQVLGLPAEKAVA